MTEERKEKIEQLLMKAGVAGDEYYFRMDEEIFDRATKRFQDEYFYQEYVKQREMGFDEYKEMVKLEIAQVKSCEELHFMLEDYNFDDGVFLPEQIICHPHCDLLTAKTVYWLMDPNHYYRLYSSLEQCSEDDISFHKVSILMNIEEKARQGKFRQELSGELCENAAEILDEADFRKEPFSKIPVELRN